MKKSSENSTVSYDPEKITEEVEIRFTRTANSSGVNIYGKIMKGGVEAGTITLDSKNNYLLTSLKPISGVSSEEIRKIYESVPRCIEEIMDNA